MPITANKLTAALKRKYGTPAAVFRRLGLDENANALPPPMRGSSDDPLREMRLEFERLLAELHLGDEHHAKVLELLDRHAPLEAGDADPPLVSSSPIQNERSNGHDEDDDEKRLGQFAEFLRRKGFSSSDIATAIDIARNGGGTAKDRLPVSALGGVLHGHMSGKSRDADLKELREHAAAIGAEPGRDHYRRPAMDKAPSKVAQGRLKARYPGIERIDIGIDDGGVPAADLRSNAEKKYPGMERIDIG